MNKVGIVLVNYNGEKYQNDCIRTIKNQTYKNFEIIVVDNDSRDNSVKILKEEYPDVTLIEVKENAGVARGNNIGINYAIENGCEYILLLNNDTEIEKDLLKNLLNRASNNTLTVPKMYYFEPSNTIWCAGGEINWKRATTTHYGMGELDRGQHDQGKFIEYAPTCCMLIHKDIFEKIGYMDENYFMYYDDTDFCVRLNRNNYKLYYEPSALLWHKVSSSSGGEESPISVYYGSRNRIYFIDKFYNDKIKVKLFYFLTRIIKLIQWKVDKKEKHIKMLIKAINDYRRNKWGLMS